MSSRQSTVQKLCVTLIVFVHHLRILTDYRMHMHHAPVARFRETPATGNIFSRNCTSDI
uniref:Uncharacterized protein n=1 Tax=Coccidioides posadasii RMSCC 3488 TaxID=454284 RepID=A0A0J6F866_COCPO|nr:hypothetical protein CPAG_01841 [Coccidioides posadasii RMSCC 3488]